MSKPKLVVLTGAGISAESGLKTFRGAGGLWEGHRVTDVATPEAFRADPEMVLRFYNERRHQAFAAQPNAGHLGLVELEKTFDVTIITQNIDDLHERAGSSHIIHLHGELRKKRSAQNPNLIEDWVEDIHVGDLAPDGGQWRPHIVWFGEQVPMLDEAVPHVYQADVLVVVGTSLVVYPAASLVDYVRPGKKIYVVDPNRPSGMYVANEVEFIEEPASTGVPKLVERLSV